MTSEKTVRKIIELWEKEKLPAFRRVLIDWGWVCVQPISFKEVYRKSHETVVIKFDRSDEDFWEDHTHREHLQWIRARDHKRRYMAREVAYSSGLLIQEKLPKVCNYRICRCQEAREVARRLRILDWQNHGWDTAGNLKFFDTDSCGSGWYNWRNK